jgi:hypothetical protein
MMWALACELTGAWPSEVAARPDLEVYLTAQLAHRLYKERNKNVDQTPQV